jgi:endogenous inhibitor of DNA gyrase (YacG/DUF329 family)
MTETTAETNPPRIVLCPTCGKRVKWTPANPFRPFCSDRCRLIDLGAWAGEEHRIPGSPEEDDLLSEDPDRG